MAVPIYQAEIGDQRYVVDTPTGDYMRAVAIASAMADSPLPCVVKIWCEQVLPDYGPYWYRIESDRFGRLVVSAATGRTLLNTKVR